jgi:hypothetical protein
MNGLVSQLRFDRIAHLPISFGQTELSAGKTITVATFNVLIGQRLEIRCLTLNLVRVMTSGVVPLSTYTSYRTCSVGLFQGTANCSPIVYAAVDGLGTTGLNCFRRAVIESPGNYLITVRNNTSNVDLSVAATGAVKVYY